MQKRTKLMVIVTLVLGMVILLKLGVQSPQLTIGLASSNTTHCQVIKDNREIVTKTIYEECNTMAEDNSGYLYVEVKAPWYSTIVDPEKVNIPEGVQLLSIYKTGRNQYRYQLFTDKISTQIKLDFEDGYAVSFLGTPSINSAYFVHMNENKKPQKEVTHYLPNMYSVNM